jgi:hypothetical protein
VLDLGFAEESAIERIGARYWGLDIQAVNASPPAPADYGVRPYHWATGAGDIAPCVIPKHGEYVVDFKTMSAFQYKGSELPEWAREKYEAQINIYMDFFDLEKGLIVAICKDSPHEMKEFEFTRNQPLIDHIYDKWKYVSGLLDDEEEPEAQHDDLWTNELTDLVKGPVAQ